MPYSAILSASISESLRLYENFFVDLGEIILGNNRSDKVVSSVEMTIKVVVCFVGLCIVNVSPNTSNPYRPLYI